MWLKHVIYWPNFATEYEGDNTHKHKHTYITLSSRLLVAMIK